MNQNKLDAAALSLAMIPVGIAGLWYAKTVRAEREKRKKIAAWEQENIACVHRIRDELVTFTESPEFTQEEFWSKMQEAEKFLKIIRNQPMY